MNRITYSHPEWQRIKDEVDTKFHYDFNFIQHNLVNKMLKGADFENIVNPSFNMLMKNYVFDRIDKEEWLEEYFENIGEKSKEINIKDDEFDSFCEWAKCNKYSKVMDLWDENEHYPMWNTLYEVRSDYLSDKLLHCIDELYEIGFGVMEGGEHFNTLLFVSGAGYNFMQKHWIPLYTKVLGYVDEDVKK
ncbi:MAG: hypothetical protein GY830_07770 [Bacteroidetes bacterium]|nr:hypothetical protein [Bacteroidota bacterium]